MLQGLSSVNSVQRDHSEKRDFRRMMINTDITLTFEGDGTPINAKCINLSGTGMLIAVSQSIEEGALCHAEMDSGSTIVTNLNAHVRVIRCETGEKDAYLLGTEILNIA